MQLLRGGVEATRPELERIYASILTAFTSDRTALRVTLFSAMVVKAKSTSAAAYLRPEALKFLRGLEKHNERDWFNERKPLYEAELKEPMLAIVRKITDAMLEFAPHHVRPAEKSVFRIYRDTRFSNDKRPYKTHVAAWWSHMGMEKTSGAGYYFQISPKGVVIAAGAYMPEKDQLAAIRNWLLENHVEFRKILQKPAVRKIFLSTTLPAETALEPNFAAVLVKHFKLLAPLVDALNTPLEAAAAPRKKVLFGLH
ncbi:MAG: DUF2461 domain-containing protein [Terracidiphilus sp.]